MTKCRADFATEQYGVWNYVENINKQHDKLYIKWLQKRHTK